MKRARQISLSRLYQGWLKPRSFSATELDQLKALQFDIPGAQSPQPIALTCHNSLFGWIAGGNTMANRRAQGEGSAPVLTLDMSNAKDCWLILAASGLPLAYIPATKEPCALCIETPGAIPAHAVNTNCIAALKPTPSYNLQPRGFAWKRRWSETLDVTRKHGSSFRFGEQHPTIECQIIPSPHSDSSHPYLSHPVFLPPGAGLLVAVPAKTNLALAPGYCLLATGVFIPYLYHSASHNVYRFSHRPIKDGEQIAF